MSVAAALGRADELRALDDTLAGVRGLVRLVRSKFLTSFASPTRRSYSTMNNRQRRRPSR